MTHLRKLRRAGAAAFTLIELLVVIAIIATLTAIVIPTLGQALRAARAVNSLSNLRQWNMAMQMYTTANDELLPWDGVDSVAASIGTRDWWANVLPPYMDSAPYSELVASGQVPVPPARTIFTDPAARIPAGAPYQDGPVKFFFCYVPNSKLNSSLPSNSRISLHSIPKPSLTVFMVEMRTHPDELPASHPFYTKSLNRAKADWQRFANRHKQGGHLAFLDGHAQHHTTEKVMTKVGNDYNQADLIWNPFGAAQ